MHEPAQCMRQDRAQSMYRVARAARHRTNLWLVQIISENGGLNYVYKDLNYITWGSTACLWRAIRLNCVLLVGHGQRRRYASCACRGSSCDFFLFVTLLQILYSSLIIFLELDPLFNIKIKKTVIQKMDIKNMR
jgi:hypothetical protein